MEEPKDPFAEFSGIMAEMMTFIEKAQAGEETDFQGFADALKTKYPDYADMIDTCLYVVRSWLEADYSRAGSQVTSRRNCICSQRAFYVRTLRTVRYAY